MRQLPTGTVSLLFTDIEGSTRLLGELGREGYVPALTEHRRLLRDAFAVHGGVEVEMQGDSFFFAFPFARDAVAAAAAGQQALVGHRWESQPIRVRMGIHTGEPEQVDGLYAGMDVHRAARVMSVAAGGQVLVSERTADLVDGELPEGISLRDLGEHRLKDLPDPIRLFQVGEQPFPPLRTPATVRLPTPATSFLGRDEELLQAITLVLDDDPRCLTIVGPGGTGKTRFALELARLLAEEATGGTYWVGLAEARDPALVLPLLAQAIGARDETSASTVEAIAERVARRPMLVLLDNVEHLLPGVAASVADLLAAAPTLRLVCTSREPLRIQGEAQYPLEPLGSSDAVRLFLERARAAGGAVKESEVVEELCRRLDGLPLAVELAAARTKLLSAEQLLDRLAGRLDLLRGNRDAEPRHRTLEATIEWSYDLLTPSEQRLLQRLSVFAGGCTLDVAEEVCGAVLEDLSALLDKSLLRRRTDPAGERFWLLETIREFAAERLHASGAGEETRSRAAAWAASLAADAWRGLRTPEQPAWLARLDAELPNLRVALDLLLAKEDYEPATGLAADLGWYFEIRDPSEGRQLLERTGVGAGGSRDDLRARSWLALFALHCGDSDAAESIARSTATRARELADTWSEAWNLNTLGIMSTRRVADDDTSIDRTGQELLERAAALAEATGDTWLQIAIGNNLAAELLEEGRFEEAADALERLSLRARAVGDSFSLAMLLGNLAFCRAASGRFDGFDALLDESSQLQHELRFDWTRVYGLSTRAYGACIRGDDLTADAATLEGLELLRDQHPNPALLGELTAMRGVLAVRRVDDARAARLFAVAHQLSDRSGIAYERAIRKLLAAAERELGQRLARSPRAKPAGPTLAAYADVLDHVLEDARAAAARGLDDSDPQT